MGRRPVDVLLVSCDPLPHPDDDMAPLLAALDRAGLRHGVAAWHDAEEDWSRARLTVIRSTWNYVATPERFLAWAAHVDAVGRLCNPAAVVRWNAHKGYLAELAAKGVPVVPTVMVAKGSDASLEAICDAEGWRRVVVKPAISAGSFETYTWARSALDEGTWRRLVGERDVLVQPFVDAVRTTGERAIVTFGGKPSHAVRKSPRFASDPARIEGPVPIAADEYAVMGAVLGALDAVPLYARVDLARGEDGRPMLMELELIEPALFFDKEPAGADRMVAAICCALEGK
ncbi:MAG: hypothetical protein R3F65_15525 [bacterium]|nr:hypothetical protein [Myxococcales bacterium]